MLNLENLLLKQEYFPVKAIPYKTETGTIAYDFRRVQIPPYHPSMVDNGIDLQLAQAVIDQAVETTIKDLESVREKRPTIYYYLDSIKRDPETKQLLYGKIDLTEDNLSISNFPMIGNLIIRKKNVQLFGKAECRINSEHSQGYFKIPQSIMLPEELMKEYDMQQLQSNLSSLKKVLCPHCWYTNDVPDIDKIFFKNFVIQYDNALVKRRYSK